TDIQVALDEALSNIVAHGYAGATIGTIVVRLACRDGEVCIEAEDEGAAFDPLQAPLPDLTADLAERQIGGLGIHFIRSLMDTVCYNHRDGKNLLRMIKRVPVRSDAPQPAAPARSDGVAVVAPQGRIHIAIHFRH